MIAMGAALAAILAVQAHAQLVTNGGFETGDFTGWSNTGDGIDIDAVFPNSGSFDAAFTTSSDDQNPGVLSQSIATTPGQSYVLDFAVVDESGQTFNSFTTNFGGFSSTITGDQAAFAYVAESFTIPAADITGTSTTLSFEGINDIAAWNLDDVSLSLPGAVPEPAAWALMLAGFGLLGAALRRRSATLAATAA
jgi:hypothetical protein